MSTASAGVMGTRRAIARKAAASTVRTFSVHPTSSGSGPRPDGHDAIRAWPLQGTVTAAPARRTPGRYASSGTLRGMAGGDTEASATSDGSRVRARRFDADRHDEVLELDDALGKEPSERQLLWIDIAGPMPEGLVERLTETFSLDETTAHALETSVAEPAYAVHGSYLHVTVTAEPDPDRPRQSPWLTAVAAPNAVITYHEEPITFLDDLDDEVRADAAYGLLDSQSFLATLLHVTATSYLRAVDRIEEDVEKLDVRSLRDRGRKDLLADLVEVRTRIAALRRLLAGHRFVYGALEGVVLGDPDDDADKAAKALASAGARYADAMAAVESARDLVLGSFNVYSTLTAQRTNDTMKVLTLVTVLLLPGSVIAGLLGMNVLVPLNKDDPMSFWIVVAGFVDARRRHRARGPAARLAVAGSRGDRDTGRPGRREGDRAGESGPEQTVRPPSPGCGARARSPGAGARCRGTSRRTACRRWPRGRRPRCCWGPCSAGRTGR